MLSTDTLIFEAGSPVAIRMKDLGALSDELHIVVYTKRHNEMKKLAQNVFIYPTNCSPLLYFWKAYGICERLLHQGGPWLITSQEAMTNFLVMQLTMQFRDIPFQAQIHTDFLSPYFWQESVKNKIRYFGYQWGVKHAQCVRVVSERIKDSLITILGVPQSKISVLPLFIDLPRLRKALLSTDLHKKYPQFDRIILMASRLSREKNFPRAFAAFNILLQRYPKTGLIVVGSGSEEKKLQHLCKKPGLTEHIFFEGWQNDLASYYKSADLLLMTSDYEGYGLTIIEALATGLPVVSTDVGVAREAGATVASSNPWSIAEKITEVFAKRGQGSLKNYPYVSRADYLVRYRAGWERCGA